MKLRFVPWCFMHKRIICDGEHIADITRVKKFRYQITTFDNKSIEFVSPNWRSAEIAAVKWIEKDLKIVVKKVKIEDN